jgi:hypothetical protein
MQFINDKFWRGQSRPGLVLPIKVRVNHL